MLARRWLVIIVRRMGTLATRSACNRAASLFCGRRYMSDNSLSGTIPIQMGELTMLTDLCALAHVYASICHPTLRYYYIPLHFISSRGV